MFLEPVDVLIDYCLWELKMSVLRATGLVGMEEVPGPVEIQHSVQGPNYNSSKSSTATHFGIKTY